MIEKIQAYKALDGSLHETLGSCEDCNKRILKDRRTERIDRAVQTVFPTHRRITTNGIARHWDELTNAVSLFVKD